MRRHNRFLIGIVAVVAATMGRDKTADAFDVSGFSFNDFTYHGHSDDSGWGSGGSGGGSNAGRSGYSGPPKYTGPAHPPSRAEMAAEERGTKLEALANLASSAYERGEFELALRYYEQAYALDPNEFRYGQIARARAAMLEKRDWHAAIERASKSGTAAETRDWSAEIERASKAAKGPAAAGSAAYEKCMRDCQEKASTDHRDCMRRNRGFSFGEKQCMRAYASRKRECPQICEGL